MNAVLRRFVLTGPALASLVWLGGCVPPQAFDTSPGHITQPAQTTAPAAPPPAPVRAAPTLAPPQPGAPVPTYTVVVNDVPVKDLLFSIARDTQYNIDLHPGITGRVSLNAVQEPLPAILDRIARQADLRYELNGRTVSIMPDTPYLKTYKVNYVNLSRNTASSIGVASQIAATGSGSASQTSGGSTSGGNNSNTNVITTSNSDYWVVLKDNLANILYATKIEQKKTEERAAIAESNRKLYEVRVNDKNDKAEITSSREQEIVRAAIPQGAAPQPGDSEREVIVNALAGTVSVFASERQHRLIREYLDTVSNASQRQVMIEATIVEVNLKDQYRAGINWKNLAAAAGVTGWTVNTTGAGVASSNLANALTPFFNVTYTNNDKWDFAATIDLLESYGNTKVLSSPKLMALNNQTALLKVVNNLVYFSVQAQQGTLSSTGTPLQPTTFTTTAHTVPVGVVMSVTPQVSETGQVSLTVRPTITRQVGFVEDPNPALVGIKNKVPIIQVREMESLLQIRSGQTVILGGLIQDDSNNARDGLPGLSRPEGIGAIFGQHERINSQTELVIFLRPIVVTNPSLESDELRQFQRLLPSARSTP
ncbi:MAG: pilus (MSHA type) biogenesis protein MshL [Hydrogenophilales bacterium 12-61-10]|nr:MAG: pilus (MSHA type) biogenesis protein MshL [Hydrogenophilales bacterium 12-61-10]OYX32527.1 MAG: pilus (MSHA type) biogenesis protein MshL [Hydrogenophilales bacterium 32-62-9]